MKKNNEKRTNVPGKVIIFYDLKSLLKIYNSYKKTFTKLIQICTDINDIM